MTIKRREFISLGVKVGGLAGLSGLSLAARAEERLTEADPMAQALGYKDDASKVDKSKTTYVAGSACGNCSLFQGKPGEATGDCPIFHKLVSAKGWCNSYVKKA